MQIEEKKNETQRGWSKRRNCLLKCFHSFKYVIDHAGVRFFFYVNSLRYTALCNSFCTCIIFSAQVVCSSHKFIAICTNFLFGYMNYSKIVLEKERFTEKTKNR